METLAHTGGFLNVDGDMQREGFMDPRLPFRAPWGQHKSANPPIHEGIDILK